MSSATSPLAVLQRLMLLSAGTRQHRDEQGALGETLTATVDWSELIGTLNARRLLAQLGPRIIDLAAGQAPPEFVELVDEALKSGRRQGVLLELISKRVLDHLESADIPAMILKGPALAERLYGDVGRRPSSDIDILVRSEQLYSAQEVVRSLGYRSPLDYVSDGGLPLLHLAMTHGAGEWPAVELHWRIHWYEDRYARERLLPPNDRAVADWHPELVDELASLLLFYARDGFTDLRHAIDIGAWWDRFGGQLQPHALDKRVERYPALMRVLSVACKVAENAVGLPSAELTGHAKHLGIRSRVAASLADPYMRATPAQLYADISLMDGLLSPSDGTSSFLRRQIFPPKGAMEERARRAHRRQARSLLSHSLRLAGRYVLAVNRVLWRRGAAPVGEHS